MSYTHTFQNRITMAPAGGGEAVYRFEPQLPKPCLHPIATPSGKIITNFEPSDHVWHRGLWFTIKFINGENFWEETGAFGRQRLGAEPHVEALAENVIRVTHAQEWSSEATGRVIHEDRTIQLSAPSAALRVIDFSTRLRALRDLRLDRTPFTTWGGYGGLTFRGSRELHDVRFHTSNGSTAQEVIGDRHDWVTLSAAVDGGIARRVSIGISDHPANPRAATPWYCRGTEGYCFFNAAFLFHDPLAVREGETLDFRYRIAYRDGEFGDGEFAEWANAFRDRH